MAYIGSTPTSQNFTSGTDYFSGTGSQTAFTLTRTVNSVNDIEVVINNVVQQPSTAYTLSGTTVTFTSAPSSGTNNIYVRYLATNMQSFTVPANSITRNSLDSNLQAGFQGRNKIINGAMTIDQRNAGASVSPSSNYNLDRWAFYNSQSSKLTIQQNAGSVTPPVGFTNYLGITSTSAYSITSTDYFELAQQIEGYNTADLSWGPSDAKSITISVWVRSSLTGTFGAVIGNISGTRRTYPFAYTINTANTWEYKTTTIPGCTDGTWLTNNGCGIIIRFGLGVGSAYSTTAGAWATSNYDGVTGATSVVGTNGATWYVTGVQLEEGTTATSFEREAYSVTLQKCQRYYFQITSNGIQYSAYAQGFAPTTTDISMLFKYPVPPRTACTGVTASGTATWIVQQSTNLFNPTVSLIRANQSNITVNASLSGATIGSGATLIDGNNASYIQFTGMEL